MRQGREGKGEKRWETVLKCDDGKRRKMMNEGK